jgi:uncharacterized FlgJ-related protein
MKTLRTTFRTFAFCLVVAFFSLTWYGYKVNGEARIEALIPKLPDFEHENQQQFLDNLSQCVTYVYYHGDMAEVNYELLLAQAVLESCWGTSRFAKEGKNLFGIRTYDLRKPHMLPWKDKPKKWGVEVFQHECDSVKRYIDVLNEGFAFAEYRKLRDNGVQDPLKLLSTLEAYASDKNYFGKIISIINKLRNEYDY